LYNGKELDTDFGLNWYHYGFRMYDPAIARFTGVDPISDQFPELSTYNYASNKPINSIDLHGLQAWEVNQSRRRGEVRTPSKKSEKDWLGSAIGYTLGALSAATAAGGAVVKWGMGGVASFLGNEGKDEVLSQATGGLSDAVDLGKMAIKGGKKAIETLVEISGVGKPKGTGGIPNSLYTQTSGDGKVAVSNFVFDADGNVTFEVNFKPHGKEGSGHGHEMVTPGDFGSGHGGSHVPYEEVPKEYLKIPDGTTPSKPLGTKHNNK